MRGTIKASASFIRDMLMIPPNWEIEGVVFDAACNSLMLWVVGENVPAGCDGEVRGELTRNEDGSIYVKWVPAEQPGPATFLRAESTGLCFWCGKATTDHGPDRICFDQSLPEFTRWLAGKKA